MKLKLIQYYTSNCTYALTAEKVNKNYCIEHGIEYFSETNDNTIRGGVDQRAIQWYKIKFIQDQLKNSDVDYVIFMDADAVVVKPEKNIRDIINDHLEKDLIIASDFGPDSVNTGVMIFKNTPWSIDFLERVWHAGDQISRGKYRTQIWHEQTIMSAFAHINLEDAKKISILDPSGYDSINDHILRPGLTFIYHDLSKIRIEDIYKLQTGNFDILTELNLSCTSDRHVSHKYADFYVKKIEELKTKDKIKILDVGGDKGIVFDIFLKYYPNLEYTNLTDCDYTVPNSKINKAIYYPISEETLDTFLIDNTEEYDLVIADFQHQCRVRDLLFSKLFDKVTPGGLFVIEDLQTDKEITNPQKNAQYGWGDPSKKSMTQLIGEFQVNGTFNSDYYDFKNLNTKIERTQIIETTPFSQLGLIYKK